MDEFWKLNWVCLTLKEATLEFSLKYFHLDVHFSVYPALGSWQRPTVPMYEWIEKKYYTGSEKSLPTFIKEKEPLWYRVL